MPKKSKKTKSVKKTTAKTVKKQASTKTAAKKTVSKTKKIIKKPTVKTVKKLTKAQIKSEKAKSKKIKEAAKLAARIVAKEKKAKAKIIAKTSAKIIAKGKVDKTKAAEKKVEAPKEVEKKHDAHKTIIARKSEGKKPVFKVGEYAVYPSHGVGKIVEIKKTLVLNQDFSCYLMFFEKEKLNIKIPVNSADKIGLRHLVSKSQMDEVFTILRSGIKKLKGMWSRRAQEYETKINSGNIILLAEVLRDLTRDIEDGDRSYSERIIYETAVYRLASEYSIIYGITFEEAKDKVVSIAKDKLNSEGKVTQKDEFDDEFDLDAKDSELDEDEESEDEDEEEEDEDDDYEDEDDDEKPRKKSRK